MEVVGCYALTIGIKEMLLESNFTEEIKTTRGNKEVL